MTPQQKKRLSILHSNIIYAATQLIIFHREHLLTIHRWRARNIINTDDEKAVVERWQQLARNHDEAKRAVLNFELELSCVRKYHKKKTGSSHHLPVVISDYSSKYPGNRRQL